MKRIIFFIFIGFISAYSLSWDVYFSQSVDTTFATTTNARGNVDLRQIVKNIIDSSSLTIDICVYSISSIQIVRSIINAKNRGVMVRIITDQSTISAPEIDSLEASGIRVISQLFGRYTSSSLMHNKFILVDFGDTTREVLVVGSFNFTDIRNADNMIVIRNAHSLMENYYREFNQMWGSTVGIPDSSRSVFERYKSEITPHMFTIDGKIVEQYFLPKDSLAEVLRRVIRGAQKEIYFSVYAFTLTDVRDVMRAMHDSIGVVVKGVIDARSFSLSVGPSMTGWAYVYSDSAYYLLHHKYLLIDPSYPALDPVILTGSPNWSSAADDNNDENFLVIHNPHIANLYLQEFAARFKESGGSLEPVSPELDHILISEVFYDTPGSDAIEEWIEFYNPTSIAVDLSGYTINNRNDFGTHYRFPSGATIPARSFFVVAKDSAGFYNLRYGINADLYANFGTLANTGDCVILKDALGQVVDYVAWEGGGAYGQPSTWGSSSLPYAESGKSIARYSVVMDTDTYRDWISNAIPTPKNFYPVYNENVENVPINFDVYPLPAVNRLTIVYGKYMPVELKIYNIAGQRMSFLPELNGNMGLSIDISYFPVGVYFLVATFPNGAHVFKTVPVIK